MMTIRVEPPDSPIAAQLEAVVTLALGRLGLEAELAACHLVGDALVADDRGWFQLTRGESGPEVTLWFHPDQLLQDSLERGAQARPRHWQLGPTPTAESEPEPDEFSAPNAQRFIYQQLLLVADVLSGRLDPATIPPSLVEAFQEAWLVTVGGRLQREGHPHVSAGERRAHFLRRFGPAGILTPRHWTIFNALWDGEISSQEEVLDRARLLPPLDRLRHG